MIRIKKRKPTNWKPRVAASRVKRLRYAILKKSEISTRPLHSATH